MCSATGTPHRHAVGKIARESAIYLFFLCKATPLSKHITPQEAEILRAEWMPLKEYLSKPLWPDYSAYWWMSRLAAEAFLQGAGDIPGYRMPTAPGLPPTLPSYDPCCPQPPPFLCVHV